MCVSASVALSKRRAKGSQHQTAAGGAPPHSELPGSPRTSVPRGPRQGLPGIAVRSIPKRCGCPFGSEDAEAEFHVLAAVPVSIVVETSPHRVTSGSVSRLGGQEGRNERECPSAPGPSPFFLV